MTVDSYAFLPRAFRAMYEAAPQFDHDPVWADFDKPLGEARIGLLSSAGMFLAGEQEPFDIERERNEPTWGDPTLRIIPNDVTRVDVEETWPGDPKQAYKDWQPSEPSPIVKHNIEIIRQARRDAANRDS